MAARQSSGLDSASLAKEDDDTVSISHSELGAPRAASTTRPSGTGGSRLASEANFGADTADDDIGNASVAFSESTSVAPSKPRSQSQSQSKYAPSGSGSGSRQPSTTGEPPRARAAGSDAGGQSELGNASIAFSDLGEPVKPRSKAPSQSGSIALSQRSPSLAGSRPASVAGAPAKGHGDDEHPIAFQVEANSPHHSPSLRSSRPSGLSGLSGLIDHEDSAAPSEAGGRQPSASAASSRRQSTTSGKPPAPAAAASAKSGISGLSGLIDHDESAAPSEAGGRQASASAASSRRQSTTSSKPPPPPPVVHPSGKSGLSGLSGISGLSGSIEIDNDADVAATVSVARSRQGDDAASTRSAAKSDADEAAASQSGSRASRPASATSRRTGASGSAAAPPARASASGGDGYSEDFDKASGGDASSQRGAALRSASGIGEEVASLPRSGSARSGGSAPKFTRKAAEGSEAGGSAAAPPARASASGSAILQPAGDAASTTSRRSGSQVFKRVSAADSPAAAATPPPAPGSTRSAASRPASAAGSAAAAPAAPRSEHGSGSAQRPGSDADAASAGDGWHDGAIRVPPPGAPRPYSARDDTGASRPRPLSAAPRDRQAAQLEALTRKHPSTWDPLDVANWVEFLGLGQYRRRFLHHAIDGRMLLGLDDAALKGELGIGPMGHRRALLDAAATVVKNYEDAQREREAEGEEAEGEEGGEEGGARRRPASAAPLRGGGALTQAPPGAPRRPASASRSVVPADSHLGPALGKSTVYEQRARLLFELDRAQARAEQHRTLAEQLQYTATLSHDEVAHIRGLLSDIERKHKAAFGVAPGAAGGAVDSQARIPWRHVGNGTRHTNWNPERFARPGDPETVDLTFQPKISTESKKMVGGGEGGGGGGGGGGGANSFMNRLSNDLRKRESSKKDLERRYYGDTGAPGGSAPAASSNDFDVVAEALQSRCQLTISNDPEEYEEAIDEALDKLATSESWREAELRDGPIRNAKGPAKLSAMAHALRLLAFMERYRSHLRSKTNKMKDLRTKWFMQSLGDEGKKNLPSEKDKEDTRQAVQFFSLLGWRDLDVPPSEGSAAPPPKLLPSNPELLDALLARAIEYRSQFDGWWERVRDRPQERAGGFQVVIDWTASPWAEDGLAPLMEAEIQRMAQQAEDVAATSAAATLTKHGAGVAGVDVAPLAVGGMDFVEFTVRLLGKSRMDDLRRMVQLPAQLSPAKGENTSTKQAKLLAVYRAVRTQKFIEFTQKDLAERDRKLRQAYVALAPRSQALASSRVDGFFERLLDDAARRRARAEKLQHVQLTKEQEVLASSAMYGRPKSTRR